MALKSYVISREVPPAPVPETRASRPRPLVVDRRPIDAGDCAGLDELRWRPSAGPRSTTVVPGLAAASRSPTPVRWPVGEAPAPHARRRRRFAESAGVPDVLLQESLPGPNRAGDSRRCGDAARRRPTGSMPRTTGDRGAVNDEHACAPRLALRRPLACGSSRRTTATASGCHRTAGSERQDSVSVSYARTQSQLSEFA